MASTQDVEPEVGKLRLRDDLEDELDDDLEWELEEGIPQFEDPFIDKYMQGRDALIEQEKKHRHGQFGERCLCRRVIVTSYTD